MGNGEPCRTCRACRGWGIGGLDGERVEGLPSRSFSEGLWLVASLETGRPIPSRRSLLRANAFGRDTVRLKPSLGNGHLDVLLGELHRIVTEHELLRLLVELE